MFGTSEPVPVAPYQVPHIRISPIARSRRIPGLRNVTALTVAPAAAALAVWLLVSLASSGAAPVYEASISLTFAGELDLPQPPPNAGAPETRVPAAADSIEFAGRQIAQPRFDFRTPFTTEISGDRRTITFFARDIVREDAVEFALYAARRFWERQGAMPISSTPGSLTVAGEREMAGTPSSQPLAVGLLVLGFAIIAVAGSTHRARRAIPAMLHMLLG
ncbi:MAG: hypothetical protein IH868_02260 [Chloroflexi bacterium]|nr:hypothetical protein [Chloroflexota bacterium]